MFCHSSFFEGEGGVPCPMGVMIRCKSLIAELDSRHCTDSSRLVSSELLNPPSDAIVAWRHPPLGVVKVNTDAAFNKATGKGSGGILLRDHLGRLFLQQEAPLLELSRISGHSLSLCGFLWTGRSGNKAAHVIAELQSTNSLRANWTSHLPAALSNIL